MSPRWSYVGVDLKSGAVLEALPLSGVQFSRVLKGYGSFSGTLDLRSCATQARCDELVGAIDPGRRCMYALADGQPVMGGPIWSAPDQDGNGDVVTVNAAEWGSYWSSVFIRSTVTYTSIDQLAIARALVTAAQAVTGGNVLTALGSETSGVNRTITYTAGSQPVIAEQIDLLSNMTSGFDYAWPVEWNGSTLRGRMLLGYPQLGTTTESYVAKASPGRVRSSTMSVDAATLATSSWAIGATGSGASGLAYVAQATDGTLLSAGYPILDKATAYSDISDTTTLQAHATADQVARGGTLTTVTATIPIVDVLPSVLNGVTSPAAVGLGDTVRFERHARRDGAAGFVATLRVTQIDYDPQGQLATLTLSPRITVGGRVPTKLDDAAQLAHLQKQVRLLAVGT